MTLVVSLYFSFAPPELFVLCVRYFFYHNFAPLELLVFYNFFLATILLLLWSKLI